MADRDPALGQIRGVCLQSGTVIGAAVLAPGCRIRCTVTFVTEQRPDAPNPWLDETTAARLVMLPLACLAKEFPWKASEV
jgi:hypothetical protein